MTGQCSVDERYDIFRSASPDFFNVPSSQLDEDMEIEEVEVQLVEAPCSKVDANWADMIEKEVELLVRQAEQDQKSRKRMLSDLAARLQIGSFKENVDLDIIIKAIRETVIYLYFYTQQYKSYSARYESDFKFLQDYIGARKQEIDKQEVHYTFENVLGLVPITDVDEKIKSQYDEMIEDYSKLASIDYGKVKKLLLDFLEKYRIQSLWAQAEIAHILHLSDSFNGIGTRISKGDPFLIKWYIAEGFLFQDDVRKIDQGNSINKENGICLSPRSQRKCAKSQRNHIFYDLFMGLLRDYKKELGF